MAGPPPGLIADSSGYLRLNDQLTAQIFRKGDIRDHFELEHEPFARGKKAVVRRCRERSSGRRLAAKYLRKRSQGACPEIVHEVAVLQACRASPHVVQLHSVFESATDVVLLLELGAGGELQTVLDKEEVPAEAQVARVMSQVLHGLLHLHNNNIVHLDLKPQNIVLTGEFPNCDIKLCDFGISRYLCDGADVREILGTPDYVAPEVLNYEPISLSTDMWSVGVLMYVLLSGCSPFGGDTKQETFCNISQCRLDFPDDLFEQISSEAKDLMTKLMVLKPCERLSAKDCLLHPWFKKDFGMVTTKPSEPVVPSLSVPEFKSSSEESTETLVDVSQTRPKSSKLDRRRNQRLSERFDNLLKTISDREEEVDNFKKKNDKPVEVTRVESFRSMTRASGMQTMPITGFLKYSLGSNQDNLHKFRRVYIIDDNPSPPISLSTVSVSSSSSGFASADSSSISDSNSEVSEMSLDSSSDRSSIISLDESLEFGCKGLSQRHYSSCYNVWEAVEREQLSKLYMKECRGSVAKALSRFNTPGPDKKEKPPVNSKLSIFNNSLSLSSTPQPKKSTGLELMKERKGNLVIIREVKTVNGSRFVRTSELKCESVQSRIRKFDPFKLDLSKDLKHEIF